jgi:hypothetical protein
VGKNDTFFFEEDTDGGLETGVTGEEQAATFMAALENEGILKERGALTSFDPMQAVSDADTKKARNVTVEVEFGIVKGDYVLHVTPIHPQKNLLKKSLLEAAIKQTVIILNKTVPPTLQVDIYMPRPDYEIKATSYVIRQATDAWNFDTSKIEIEVVPQILEQVGKICQMA